MDCFASLAMTAESDPARMRAQPNFLNRISAILPVQLYLKKSLRDSPKSHPSLSPSRPTKGRFAIVTDVAAGCSGRGQCQKANDADSTLAKGSADRCQTVEWLFERCSAEGEGVWS
jgi:hypothetical protein